MTDTINAWMHEATRWLPAHETAATLTRWMALFDRIDRMQPVEARA